MLEPVVSEPFDLAGIPVEDDSAVRIKVLSDRIAVQSRRLRDHLEPIA